MPLLVNPALASAFSVQALAIARLEAARRANYSPRHDKDLHRRLTAAQAVLIDSQTALYPLLTGDAS